MNNLKDSRVLTNEYGDFRYGALSMWECYDAYLSTCRDMNEVSLNVYQYPRWYRHHMYLGHLKKKLNGSLKYKENGRPETGYNPL